MSNKHLKLNDCVSLIEQMNNYMVKNADEREAGIRFAESVLNNMLGQSVDRKLADAGITTELLEKVEQDDKAALKELIRIASDELNFSQIKLRELKNKTTHNINKKAISEMMVEYLISKEKAAFIKSLDVAHSVWTKFINAQVRTSNESLKKIAAALRLNEKDTQDFIRLCPALYYDITYSLAKATDEYIKGTNVKDFKTYAFMDNKSLAAYNLGYFNKDKKDQREEDWNNAQQKKAQKKRADKTDGEYKIRTSQNTLLKLIAGFGVGEEEAKSYLELAGSHFVTVCDLAFLTAITLGYEILGRRDPIDVMDIVCFLSNGNMLFGINEYTDREDLEKYEKFKGYGFTVPYK